MGFWGCSRKEKTKEKKKNRVTNVLRTAIVTILILPPFG